MEEEYIKTHPDYDPDKMDLMQIVPKLPNGEEINRPEWHGYVYGGGSKKP